MIPDIEKRLDVLEKRVGKTTRKMIADFHLRFNHPVEQILVEEPSVELRILRAKLLLEEAIETITKGLGLKVYVDAYPPSAMTETYGDQPNEIEIMDVGAPYDPIETADGLGDVNVIIHGTAHVLGMNLDKITAEIHRSNMSKLGADGQAITNGVTPGYRGGVDPETGGEFAEEGFDPTKPIGKILKGPNYTEPNLGPILRAGNWLSGNSMVHIDESEISEHAQLDYCIDHPNATSTGGFGLAGGGFGGYMVCDECGRVFGKQNIEEWDE